MNSTAKFLFLSCLVSTVALYGDFNDVSAQIIHGETKYALEGLKQLQKAAKAMADDPSWPRTDAFDIHRKQKPFHPDFAPYVGWTLLMIAAAKGNLDIVKALVHDYGVDTAVTNDQHETALDLARRFGHNNVVSFLENSAR